MYIQKDFRLSAKHRKYLEDKNDSVIINHPGFDHAELDQLLLKAHPEYSNVFVGDGKVGSKVANFNKANNTNYKFVNCRASPLVYQNSNYSSSASL